MVAKPKEKPRKSLESCIWDAACSIRGAKDTPKYKDYILPKMASIAPKWNPKNINMQGLKRWPLIVPPRSMQKKIVHIRSTVQWGFEAQKRIIQATAELKNTLIHKLFIKGLRNEPQKLTEIGRVPESWARLLPSSANSPVEDLRNQFPPSMCEKLPRPSQPTPNPSCRRRHETRFAPH